MGGLSPWHLLIVLAFFGIPTGVVILVVLLSRPKRGPAPWPQPPQQGPYHGQPPYPGRLPAPGDERQS